MTATCFSLFQQFVEVESGNENEGVQMNLLGAKVKTRQENFYVTFLHSFI